MTCYSLLLSPRQDTILPIYQPLSAARGVFDLSLIQYFMIESVMVRSVASSFNLDLSFYQI